MTTVQLFGNFLSVPIPHDEKTGSLFIFMASFPMTTILLADEGRNLDCTKASSSVYAPANPVRIRDSISVEAGMEPARYSTELEWWSQEKRPLASCYTCSIKATFSRQKLDPFPRYNYIG